MPTSSSLRTWTGIACAGCLAVSACGGDDDGSNSSVGPTGPVELSITGFLNNRGEAFDRDAERVELSCDGTINVLLGPRSGDSLTNWLLRPPGACESFEQCGYVVLIATPEAGDSPTVMASASTSLVVAPATGRHDLLVELLTGDSEPFLQDNEPVRDTLSDVLFSAPLDCLSGAGGAHTGDTTSTAGGFAGAPTTDGGGAGAAGAGGQAGGGGEAGDAQG